jgi:hypothetical protein
MTATVMAMACQTGMIAIPITVAVINGQS